LESHDELTDDDRGNRKKNEQENELIWRMAKDSQNRSRVVALYEKPEEWPLCQNNARHD
jgi:hypothetical protein